MSKVIDKIHREKGDTWPKILRYNFEKYGENARAMRHKHYGIWQPHTWKEYYLSVKYLALGLLSLGFKPGDKLPTEMELAQQLGVGRNSVREAIKMLSYLGVVEIRRGIGTYVAETMPPSVVNPLILGLVFEQKTSREIIELRLLIETAVAEMLMQKIGL